jgi:hypothetical protein
VHVVSLPRAGMKSSEQKYFHDHLSRRSRGRSAEQYNEATDRVA